MAAICRGSSGLVTAYDWAYDPTYNWGNLIILSAVPRTYYTTIPYYPSVLVSKATQDFFHQQYGMCRESHVGLAKVLLLFLRGLFEVHVSPRWSKDQNLKFLAPEPHTFLKDAGTRELLGIWALSGSLSPSFTPTLESTGKRAL